MTAPPERAPTVDARTLGAPTVGGPTVGAPTRAGVARLRRTARRHGGAVLLASTVLLPAGSHGLAAQIRPTARRTEPMPARTGRPAAAPPTAQAAAATLASLRPLVFRGNWVAARDAGRLGAAALPLMREALADADPVARRAGAVVAAGIGRDAAGACDALVREAATVPPFAGDGAWPQSAGANPPRYAGVRDRMPAGDLYLAPVLAGCPADATSAALAAAAARAFEIRHQAATGAAGSPYTATDATERAEAAGRATGVLSSVFAAAAQLPPEAPGAPPTRTRLAPFALRALTDTAGLRMFGGDPRETNVRGDVIAASHAAGLRYATTVGLYTPELEREVQQQWLAPPRWAFFEEPSVLSSNTGVYEDFLRQRPDRMAALARTALEAPPAPVSTSGDGPMAVGGVDRRIADIRQRRALGLAGAAGPDGAAVLADVVLRDLDGARAAVRAGDPDGGPAGKRLYDAMRTLGQMGTAARGAAPALAAVLQADLPPGTSLVKVARDALGQVQGR